MEGGEPGALGRNTWVKHPRKEDGDLPPSSSPSSSSSSPSPSPSRPKPRHINIGGKATVFMGKGDRLLIETPGAGAWGVAEEDKENAGAHDHDHEHGHVKAWAPRGSLAEREAAQAGF